MDDPSRRQVPAGGDDRFARSAAALAPAYLHTFLEYRLPALAVYGPVDPTPPKSEVEAIRPPATLP